MKNSGGRSTIDAEEEQKTEVGEAPAEVLSTPPAAEPELVEKKVEEKETPSPALEPSKTIVEKIHEKMEVAVEEIK